MSYGTTQVLRFVLWCIVAIIAWMFVVFPAQAQIPPDAGKHRRELTRNARMIWGLDAPVSTFAGQIHQESGWRADAVSPVGASGLAQFMPATATWISGLQAALQDNQPMNPTWALRAVIEYNKWLYDRVPPSYNHCERMAFVLSSYNGGMGWLIKDVQLAKKNGADPTRWFDNVEKFNGGRSMNAFAENRGYPNRILNTLERRYSDAGWGIKSC